MRVSFACLQCGRGVDGAGWIWRCPGCGGPVDFAEDPQLEPTVTLGEPVTPLVDLELGPLRVLAKLEGSQPTGSFKDRGSRMVVSALAASGVERAVIDSSGN